MYIILKITAINAFWGKETFIVKSNEKKWDEDWLDYLNKISEYNLIEIVSIEEQPRYLIPFFM